jgi:glycosyltransferase involved in cell wall biosynthesis
MFLNKGNPLNIVFDCERMKYAYTGPYHFCLQLGSALLRNTDLDQNITFYVTKKAGKVFGPNAVYLDQKSIHKFLFPPVKVFDILHSTYQGSNYIPSSKRIKKVLTIHDLNFLYENEHRPEKIKHSLHSIQKHINNADKICTISEYVKKDVEQHLQLKGKEIEVIYNGCNIAPIAQLIEPEMSPEEKFIFTVGTINPKKNFHVLPALLRNNSLLLIIAGIVQDENYKTKILQEAEKLNVAKRVLFTGAVSENDKQWYLKNCLAFAFPSIAEGFGLPVIEAMAFGKPVFLSTATSLPEIGGDAAFYFQSFDADDVQEAFKKGMNYYNTVNPVLAIMNRAASFNWDNAAKKYLSVYRSLAG